CEPDRKRRLMLGLRQDTDFRRDPRVHHVVRAVAGESQHRRQRRRLPMSDRQVIEESAVDLQFGYRAQADADADRWQPNEVPFEPRNRITDVMSGVEAAFDQHAACADWFGIFGYKRTLLRQR